MKLASYRVSWKIRKDMASDVYSEVECDLESRSIRVYLNSRRIDDGLEDTLVHELLHVFIYKYLGIAEDSFMSRRRFKSLKKYLKGEERAITILSALLVTSIFKRRDAHPQPEESGGFAGKDRCGKKTRRGGR